MIGIGAARNIVEPENGSGDRRKYYRVLCAGGTGITKKWHEGCAIPILHSATGHGAVAFVKHNLVERNR
jgi:hypothetical protein